jgi:aspartyl-tRNA(Asn)/glutamyl-tRNA(Gln) amidotransferase subunit B
MYESGDSAQAIVDREGLAQISDESSIREPVARVLAANTDAVAQYRAGKKATFGFLVGQVMKATGGKASPRLVNELLRRELERA